MAILAYVLCTFILFKVILSFPVHHFLMSEFSQFASAKSGLKLQTYFHLNASNIFTEAAEEATDLQELYNGCFFQTNYYFQSHEF